MLNPIISFPYETQLIHWNSLKIKFHCLNSFVNTIIDQPLIYNIRVKNLKLLLLYLTSKFFFEKPLLKILKINFG